MNLVAPHVAISSELHLARVAVMQSLMEAFFFSQQEAEQYRRDKTITFKGRECPNPILKFQEANFPCMLHTLKNITQIQSFTILTPLSPIPSICDGCDQQTELHRANPYSGSGLAPCAQWQGHGWHCADWIWQDSFCKLLLYLMIHLFLHVDLRASLAYKGVYLLDALQYLLPAIVHINHQAFLERGDGPIVSIFTLPSWVDLFLNLYLNP